MSNDATTKINDELATATHESGVWPDKTQGEILLDPRLQEIAQRWGARIGYYKWLSVTASMAACIFFGSTVALAITLLLRK